MIGPYQRQYTTLTTDRHPKLWWDSNTQSQDARCRRPIPYTARPPGPDPLFPSFQSFLGLLLTGNNHEPHKATELNSSVSRGQIIEAPRWRTKCHTIDCAHNTFLLNPFYYQLMHITLKNAELLKHSKLDKNAPTCFGLHRNHLQGAKVSVYLHTVHDTHALQVTVTIFSHNTDDALHIFYADTVDQTCNF